MIHCSVAPFSYFDTQITRLGGPTSSSFPSTATWSVNPMMQDGFGQSAILAGRTRYSPNSLGGGCPFTSTMAEGGYERVARAVSGTIGRRRADPQPDYFTQATMFWNSMSPVEREHIVAAFSFELGKVEVAHVRERMVQNLAEVDPDLVGAPPRSWAWRPRRHRAVEGRRPATFRASQIAPGPGPVDGRLIAVLAADGCDAQGIMALAAAATEARAPGRRRTPPRRARRRKRYAGPREEGLPHRPVS